MLSIGYRYIFSYECNERIFLCVEHNCSVLKGGQKMSDNFSSLLLRNSQDKIEISHNTCSKCEAISC